MSSDTDAVDPTKLPLDVPCRMNAPVGLVDPCPDTVVADGFISAEPDEIVYVVAPMTTLPLIESVYPSVRFPVTVKTREPDAVPFSLAFPIMAYRPAVLVRVIVCPTEMSALPCGWPNPLPPCWVPPIPGPPPWEGGPPRPPWPGMEVVELVFQVVELVFQVVELVFQVVVEDVERVVVGLDVDVCAVAVDIAGYASSIAMKAMVDAVTVAVFANLVVMFKG
jgi:hypothetical protein